MNETWRNLRVVLWPPDSFQKVICHRDWCWPRSAGRAWATLTLHNTSESHASHPHFPVPPFPFLPPFLPSYPPALCRHSADIFGCCCVTFWLRERRRRGQPLPRREAEGEGGLSGTLTAHTAQLVRMPLRKRNSHNCHGDSEQGNEEDQPSLPCHDHTLNWDKECETKISF